MSGATTLVTLVALAVRLILWATRPGLTYDGTYYLRQAERLFQGDYLLVGFPPGYPLVVAALRLVVGDFELAGRLASLLASIATVAIFHVWARRHLPGSLALVGALFLALHPEMVRSGVEILSEPLYIFCIVYGCFLFEQRREVLAGAFLGYAFLVRPEAILLILGCLLWRLWSLPHRPAGGSIDTHGRRSTNLPLGFFFTALVPVIVYAALASQAVGHWVLSPKQGQLDLGSGFGGRLWQTAKAVHALFPFILVPVAVFQGWRGRLLALAGILYVVSIPFFDVHVQPRLLQPALPFFLLLSLVWISTLQTRIKGLAFVIAAALMLWGGVPVFRSLLRPGIVTPYDRALGESLRSHLGFEDRVACRFPIVPYYAGAGFARVPLASYLTTMDSLVTLGATHLLLLEHEVLGMIPQLRPLFDDASFAAAEGRLEMQQTIVPSAGQRALLYRFRTPLIAPSRSPVIHEGVVSATWSASTLFFTTRDGRLHQTSPEGTDVAPTSMPQLAGLKEIRASDDGRRLACTLQGAEGLVLADLDLASGALRSHATTLGDLPGSPCWVGDTILYVVQAGEGGLRALDVKTGKLRSVLFSGVDPSEATPLFVTSRGKEIATTYVRPQRETADLRVLATASWPDVAGADDTVILQGRWAIQVPLADDAIAWVPGADRLLGSAAIRELDEENRLVRGFSSLAVFAADGRLRTLSFGLESPRHPVAATKHLAFFSDDGLLRIVVLGAEELRIPQVRVFDAPRESLRPVPP